MTTNSITLEQQLIGRAWTSPDIYANLEQLCDFGSRFGGTESERLARDWLLQKFQTYGLTSTRLEGFDYTGWFRGTCGLKVIEPNALGLRTAISLVYSPSTPPTGLQAEVIDLGYGSEAEYAARQSEIAGKIVLVTSANPEGGPWIHRREKYGRAVANGAVGFIFMNHLPGLLAPTGSLRPGRLGEIPAVGLGHEEGFNLQRWCKRGRVMVELNVQNDSHLTQAHHVVGEVAGSQPDELILIGAHYDGHDISQGAMDDGSGVAVLLELARLFGPLASQLRRSLRFVAFAVEELGVLGSTEYVRLHQTETNQWGLMLNLDGGVGIGPHGFSVSGFSELKTLLQNIAGQMGHDLTLNNQIGTATDAFPFVMAGVPALNFIARQRDLALGRGYGHTAADTLDKVKEIDLKAAAAVAGRVLFHLANQAEPLAQHRNREELKQILIDHKLEQPLRAQDKWPFD